MAFATTEPMQRLLAEAVREHIAQQERDLRELLGRWVSELEPATIFAHDGTLLGVGMKGDPEGRVVLAVPGVDLRRRYWLLSQQSRTCDPCDPIWRR